MISNRIQEWRVLATKDEAWKASQLRQRINAASEDKLDGKIAVKRWEELYARWRTELDQTIRVIEIMEPTINHRAPDAFCVSVRLVRLRHSPSLMRSLVCTTH